MNIAVFCSGNGSNFQAIADASKMKIFDAKIALMVCDNKEAFALERAKKANVKTLLVLRENFKTREDFENKIMNTLGKEDIELICLAGFMRVLSPEFIKRYENKILNIHPALLPSFKGTHGIKDAFEYGVKATGVTVHFVSKEVDSGPIILQDVIRIEEGDTPEALEKKIHAVEHNLYPKAICLFEEGRLTIEGRRVRIR